MSVYIKFFGVRGSTPSPLSGANVYSKMATALSKYSSSRDAYQGDVRTFLDEMPFWQRATYGGNTSCVLLTLGKQRFVLDMGSGLRQLGNELFPEMFKNKGFGGETKLTNF